jgi:hypothetical protein
MSTASPGLHLAGGSRSQGCRTAACDVFTFRSGPGERIVW